MQKKKTEERESIEGRREREGRDMMRQERKIYFLYVRSESKVHLQTRLGGSEESGNLLLCSFKMERRRKKKKEQK